MPSDYIQVGPQNIPRPVDSTWSSDPEGLSRLLFQMAQFVESLYKKALAARQEPGEEHTGVDTRTNFKDRAAGDLSPVSLDPENRARTPLQNEVRAILERYQLHLLKVPDLASTLNGPSENFSQMVDVATGRRTPQISYLMRVDPRSFDFADLVIFAYDRGFTVNATSNGLHGQFGFHYDGRAADLRDIDKSEAQIRELTNDANAHGVRVLRHLKAGDTKESDGPHLHLDTGTTREVRDRQQMKARGGTRIDLGIGADWPGLRP